jgi:hypothetical protein
MTDKHTPEPWKLCSKSYEGGGDIVGPSGESIFFGDPFKEIPDVRKHADARRIVACVNACEGIPTVMLESIEDLFEFAEACADDLERWVIALRRTCDEFKLKERRRR